jgi:hypothetical protein
VLANDEDAIAKRKPLAGEIGDSGIERGVTDGDAGRCGNYPLGMLVRPIPQLDPEGQVGWDTVQVRVRQLA